MLYGAVFASFADYTEVYLFDDICSAMILPIALTYVVGIQRTNSLLARELQELTFRQSHNRDFHAL